MSTNKKRDSDRDFDNMFSKREEKVFATVATILIITLCVAMLFALSACSKVESIEAVPAEGVKEYTLAFGHYIREFELDDGTRCVAYSAVEKGGLTCDWQSN